MQDYTKTKRESLKTVLFFLAFLVIAYLPVSSFLFFLKNDAFNGYFPPKFFMSESIRSGYLPLWNPYINFGLPQYGDMSSGYWSPVTWLIASTTGYNAYTFTLELLFYLLIAGLGMYKLCRSMDLNRHVSLVAGLSYMCCGYMIGHLQHFNWISGAAFLPLCTWAYNVLQQEFSLKNTVTASLLFYLLAASAHPGITIGAIYFFTAYALFLLFYKKTTASFAGKLAGFLKSNLSLAVCLCLLAAGMIAAYADIIPHITRGEKVAASAMANPVTFSSIISALLPMSTVRNDSLFNTDPSMRNLYWGITLLLFFLLSLLTKKDGRQWFFLFTGLFFSGLSSGLMAKTGASVWLPLAGFVRMNGEFAIFALFCFILTAAITLNKFIREHGTFTGRVKHAYHFIELLLFGAVIYGIYQVRHSHDSFLYALEKATTGQGMADRLKALLDSISFYDTLWIQGIIILMLTWGVKWCLMKRDHRLLAVITAVDLILASLLNIPFTGVGKAPVAEVQAVLNKSPKGIIIPPLVPVNLNDSITAHESGLVGNWSFYNKQPGVKSFAFYPVELLGTGRIFNDPNGIHFSKPFVFLAPDTVSGKIQVNRFTGNSISINANAGADGNLVFQQQYYPHWYVIAPGKKEPAGSYNGMFLSAAVKRGPVEITFLFDPAGIKKAMLVSIIAFITFIIILLAGSFKRTSPS